MTAILPRQVIKSAPPFEFIYSARYPGVAETRAEKKDTISFTGMSFRLTLLGLEPTTYRSIDRQAGCSTLSVCINKRQKSVIIEANVAYFVMKEAKVIKVRDREAH